MKMLLMMMMTTTMMMMIIIITITIIIIRPQIPGFLTNKTERTEINQKVSTEFCTVLCNVLKTELNDEGLTDICAGFLISFSSGIT